MKKIEKPSDEDIELDKEAFSTEFINYKNIDAIIRVRVDLYNIYFHENGAGYLVELFELFMSGIVEDKYSQSEIKEISEKLQNITKYEQV